MDSSCSEKSLWRPGDFTDGPWIVGECVSFIKSDLSGSEKWRVESGEWRMDNGEWRVESEK
jgi:hypothetical protein